MRQLRTTSSGVRLILIVVCLTLLILPGVVIAETLDTTTATLVPPVITGIVPNITTEPATTILPKLENTTLVPVVTTGIETNVTIIPTTPVPPVFLVRENTTAIVNPPPLLIFDTPVLENLTCTIYGIVDPGSANVNIASIFWDWGDGSTPEYHRFPNSHVYGSPGTYTISIAARQSDGQKITGTTYVSVGLPPVSPTHPVTPIKTPVSGVPAMVINPPVLTILEPVVDGSNVTLNGNLNAGSPGVTIKSVSVDWDDGTATQAADLPVSHHYPSFGIFTVVITAYQSDGQSTTKRITLEIADEGPVVPGPGPSVPPPNNDSPLYLIALATAIIVMAIVIVGQWIMQKKKGTYEEPDSQKVFSPRNGKMSENLPSPEDLSTICAGTDVTPDVLEPVVRVAMEIAREGREGQAIGTSFVVGDTQNVMNHSKQFVLNPFHGYHEADRRITDEGIRGNIKEFAQLDGAFLITDTGVVEAAGRCITVDMSQVNLPGGLGSRHSSIAGITKVTKSIGIVVSQSGGMISIFRDGKIVYTIKS